MIGRTWWRPTLVRRLVLALVLAFVAIWLANLGAIFWQVAGVQQVDARLRGRADSLLGSIAPLHSADEARAAAAAVSSVLGRTDSAAGLRRLAPANPRAQQGDLSIQLFDAAGARLYATPQFAHLGFDAGEGQVLERSTDDTTWRVYRRDSARWTVVVAEARFSTAELLLRISRDMGFYLLAAFLLVVAVIWLAVARGMRPLRLLSVRIAGRGADNLEPLGIDPKYAELKPLAEAVDRLLAQLRARIETERAFVQDAAHELRTPLAVIAAQAHTLALAAGEQQRAEAALHLEQAVQRASHLIGQLLTLAQVDSAAPTPGRRIDVAQLVRQQLATLLPAALARDIELELEAPDVLHHAVDLHALQSIVQNLLTNALRYVQDGGQVLVQLGQPDGKLRLSVADNGPGIPPAERGAVFERFRRGAGHSSPGAGLGLAIVRQAAARMRGTVALSNGLGGYGCCFTVEIPGL